MKILTAFWQDHFRYGYMLVFTVQPITHQTLIQFSPEARIFIWTLMETVCLHYSETFSTGGAKGFVWPFLLVAYSIYTIPFFVKHQFYLEQQLLTILNIRAGNWPVELREKLLFHTGGNVDTVLSLVTSVPLACDTSLKMETTCYGK